MHKYLQGLLEKRDTLKGLFEALSKNEMYPPDWAFIYQHRYTLANALRGDLGKVEAQIQSFIPTTFVDVRMEKP